MDWELIDGMAKDVVYHYEKTAPTVSRWADELYMRLNEDPAHVRVAELMLLEDLWPETGKEPVHPNIAANRVYKMMHRLGQDTTGHAGF